MQVIKDITTGLLFSPFAIAGTWRLQVAVLHYFDLHDPDTSLSEQDLWPETTPLLGEGGFIDPGFPKACGEVLIAASWHASGGQPLPGGRAAFQTGPIQRELLVFGNRYWQAGPAGPQPSQPDPVLRVPLAWEYAYGGEEFGENPRGKGHIVQTTPWNEPRRPLPNIEDPAAGLMGAPSDQPVPACFGLRILDAPSRIAQAGSYGLEWQKLYWPGFPPDVRPEFFQMASPAQRLPSGHFQGGEPVVLEGMHPHFARIESRLPKKRVRVFATRVPDAKKPDQTLFEEASGSLETVWFFPEILRGVALYRTVLACADDESSDLIRLFPVMENADALPTDIHYWHAEEQERLPKMEPLDPAPLEEAKAAMEEVKANVRTIEEDMHFTLDQASGLAPVIAPTYADQLGRARDAVQAGLAQVDAAQKRMREVRKEYGHLVKIDPRSMDDMRSSLLALLPEIETMEKGLAEGMEDIDKIRKDISADAKKLKAIQAETPDLQGLQLPFDPEEQLAQIRTPFDPPHTWSETALALLAKHSVYFSPHKELFNKAGLSDKGMIRAGFAFLPEPLPFIPGDWFLPPELSPDESLPQEPHILPRGLLIPWFEGQDCVRLAVRPLPGDGSAPEPAEPEYPQEDLFFTQQDILVPGSQDGAQLLGAHRLKPLLLAPDPVTAWLLYREAGDLFAVLIPTSPEAELPPAAADAVANAPCALWPVPPSLLAPDLPPERFAAEAQALAAPWQALAPALEPVPWAWKFDAPHLGTARRLGLNIRTWLFEELEKRAQPVPAPEQEGGLVAEAGKDGALSIALTVPAIDFKGIQERIEARIDTMVPRDPEPFPESEQHWQQAKEAFAEHDIELPELESMWEGDPMDDLNRLDLSRLDRPEEMLKARTKDLIPEFDEMMADQREFLTTTVEDAKQLYQEGLQQIDAGNTLLAMPLAQRAPEWVHQIPGAQGILNAETMTPELALQSLRAGESKGLSLKNLDFSGMDLSGCVFKEMFLEDISFQGADLRRARFEQVIGARLDFTDALLDEAVLYLSSFSETVLCRCSCRGMRAELFNMAESRISSVDFEGAFLKLTNINDSSITGHIRGLECEIFSLGKDLHDLVFHDCRLFKGIILEGALASVAFSGGSVEETGFINCTGENFSLTGVNAQNMRIVTSTITGARFTDCSLKAASLRESSLPQAFFSGCRLDRACVEHCEMPFAVMRDCRAPQARICHSNLEGAQLSGLSLPGGSLRRTRLVQADLTDANLYSVELYKAVFGDTLLHGANLTQTLVQNAEGILRREGMAQ